MDLDYNILKASNSDELIERVKESFTDGWGVLGEAMFVPMSVSDTGRAYWYQTLYKDTNLQAEAKSQQPITIEGFSWKNK